jgi:hypothetical protein
MAYADDSDLIADVQVSASRLGVAATWSSGTALNVTNDFLYEMYVLFRLIEDLSSGYHIEYYAGSGSNKHALPRKGASKAGRPRFNIKDKTSQQVLNQLCAGTRAADLNGHLRALDISIQKAVASDTPGKDDVLQIIDAKYRTKKTDPISHHEFSEFARWIELFELRGRPTPGLTFSVLGDLDANCLVTNGRFSTELDAECQRVSLCEIEKFHPLTTHAKRP